MNTPDRTTFIAQMRALSVKPDDPYIRVYPSFLRFFQERREINRDDFVIGACFTYGWMQRILKLHGIDEDWVRAAGILNRAKLERIALPDDLNFLKSLINHSFIGVSKVLHFVNPEKHAIWDSRVYRYLTGKRPHHAQVNDLKKFVRYLEICDEITAWPELAKEVARVGEKLGQDLTAIRAIELTMWANGKP